MAEPFFQSSLGEVTSIKTTKDRSWNHGYLGLAKVVRVHPKRYTADVVMLGTGDTITSISSDEGRFACRIAVSNAGFNKKHSKPYGQILPIQVGSIVLVGFLKNEKDQPVIIATYHDISEQVGADNVLNILGSGYDAEEDGSIDKLVNITGTQDFSTVDGEGNFEFASHTKSFLVGKDQFMDDETYDYEDLSIKGTDGKTIGTIEDYSAPKKYMAVFRDNFTDSLTNWLKIIVDAAKTSFRLAKIQQGENKSTYMEITQGGDFKLRRQLDSKCFDDTQDTPSKMYSEFGIKADGNISVESKIDNLNSKFIITPEGTISMDSQANGNHSTITMTPDGTLSIATEAGERTEIVIAPGGAGLTINTTNKVAVNANKKVDITSNHTTIRANKLDVTAQLNLVGIGKMNGRKLIVAGDKDSHGYTIRSTVGCSSVSINEAFTFTQLSKNTSLEEIATPSGVMGNISQQVGFNNFDTSQGINNMTGSLGIIPDSMNSSLTEYCNAAGLNPLSVEGQSSFIQDKLDVSKITNPLSSSLGSFEAGSQVYNQFTKLSNINSIVDTVSIPSDLLSISPNVDTIIKGAISDVDLSVGEITKVPDLTKLVHVGDVIGVDAYDEDILATPTDAFNSLVNCNVVNADINLEKVKQEILSQTGINSSVLEITHTNEALMNMLFNLYEEMLKAGKSSVTYYDKYKTEYSIDE